MIMAATRAAQRGIVAGGVNIIGNKKLKNFLEKMMTNKQESILQKEQLKNL